MTGYLQYGPDDGTHETVPTRICPECRGRCEDKHGDPCETCHGEGEILY